MIVFAIVILIAGILLVAAPKLVYEITQSWKSNSDSEPSNYSTCAVRKITDIITDNISSLPW